MRKAEYLRIDSCQHRCGRNSSPVAESFSQRQQQTNTEQEGVGECLCCFGSRVKGRAGNYDTALVEIGIETAHKYFLLREDPSRRKSTGIIRPPFRCGHFSCGPISSKSRGPYRRDNSVPLRSRDLALTQLRSLRCYSVRFMTCLD